MRPYTGARWLTAACRELRQAHDELTALDAAAGDGDLGITVRAGCDAVAEAVGTLSEDCTAADLLRTAGAAFARGNPSSFAALSGAGLLAAAKELGETTVIDVDAVANILSAAKDRIAERGRAQVGDRTVLDALVPAHEAMRGATTGPQALDSMILAARSGVDATVTMVPTRGRAAWVGERALGVPDGGATAFLRLLEAMEKTRPGATTSQK